MNIVTQLQKVQVKIVLSHNTEGSPAQTVNVKNTLQGTMQKIACGAAVTLCLALTPSLVFGASSYQPEGAADYPGIVMPDPEAPKVQRTHGVPGYPNEDLNAVAPSAPTHMIEEVPGRGAVTSTPPATYTQQQIADPGNVETNIALPGSTYTDPAPAYNAEPSYPSIVMPDPAAPKVRRTHGVPGYPGEDLNAVAPSLPTTTHQDGPVPAVFPASDAAQPAPMAPQPYQPEPMAPQPYQPEPMAPQPYQPAPMAPQPYQPAPMAPQPYQPAPMAPQPYQPEPMAPQPYQPAPELEPYPVTLQPQPGPGTPQPAVQPYPPNTQYAPSGAEEGDMGSTSGINPVPVEN